MNLKIFTDNIEEKAREQIDNLLAKPAFSECKVRIMPDVHAGAGCVIGFTANLGDKVIPNVVGVDIGCGVFTYALGTIDVDYDELDKIIRDRVPSGMNVHEDPEFIFPEIEALYCYDSLKNKEWLRNSLGTLGGGNHFIEIDEDSSGYKYLIIHTGSRNIGKQVAEYYQNLAIERINGGKSDLKEKVNALIAEYKETGREKEISEAVKELRESYKAIEKMPNDLCYLEGEDRLNYLHDMAICQRFAHANRIAIAQTICNGLGVEFCLNPSLAYENTHNYIDLDTNIIRKGAISAKEGEIVVIPMNMRDGCIIGIGKGNDDWNCSAPHGAGRIMSRMQAKKTVSMEDYEKSMEGIYTTSVSEETLDECPMAYKPIDEIVENIKDTVEIIKKIKPVYNFKAGE